MLYLASGVLVMHLGALGVQVCSSICFPKVTHLCRQITVSFSGSQSLSLDPCSIINQAAQFSCQQS